MFKMLNEIKTYLKKAYNRLDIILIIILWFCIFLGIFYKGSINVGMWGNWQGLEMVVPIIISFFVSLLIISPVYLIRRFLKNKKRK